MRVPVLTLIVPTHREDRPLARCLDSVRASLRPRDEVIVVGDTHSTPLPAVERLVQSYGKRFRYLAHDAGHHCYGHCQINAALEQAKGDLIHCNDDDDVWAEGALDAFRAACPSKKTAQPRLFRFKSYHGGVYWHTRGYLQRDHIGGHCLLVPNVPGKVGRFACAYNGDFDWIRSTLDLWGGDGAAVWHDEIVCIARPS